MKKLTSRNNLGRAVSVFLLLSACLPASALPGPTGASYAWGAQLTVAGYDANKGTLMDFPVLMRISPETVSGFQYSQMLDSTTGSDLCFIDMSGNGLPFEIDTWDPQGTSLVWVTLPTMLQGSQFVMCWGGATSGKTVCSANPFAGYYGVWHMNEANAKDSTPNHLDGTAAASVSVVAAKLGTGTEFPSGAANSTKIQTTNTLNSAFSSAISFETWACPYIDGSERALFGKEALATFKIKSGKTWFTTPGKLDFDKIGVSLTANTWYHIVLTFTPNQSAKLYINGELVKTQTDSKGFNNLGLSCPIVFGNNQWSQYYNGILDECRLLTTELSADWISASYATQSDAAFLTAGAATAYEASAEPQVGVVATEVQYTNATLTVTFGSLGKNDAMTADASWVDATLFVATDDTFAAPVLSVPLARATSAPSSASMPAVPLVTNTTYYAKVVASNSFNVAGESSVASFTTCNPGFAVGAALFQDRGFSTISATATTTDFGTGAESATMRLEASTDGFATVVAGAEVPATISTTETLSGSGLAANTEYALRVRIRNDWGLDTFVTLPATATRAVPFATTGIGWTFSPDGSTIDIDFGISGVYDGATGSATLTYNGQTVAPAQAVSGTETLIWPAIPAANGTATATIVLSATLDGQTYSQTFTATIAPGSTAVSVSDISEHTSATTAVRIHPGDVVTLPELSGTASYILGNRLFGSLDGNVLTALRPGILGIHCIGSDSTTNTMAVLVLPEKIGNGNIYIFKDESIGNDWGYWNEAAKWEKLGSETNDSFPHEPDDIAIVAYYRNTNIQFDARDADISLGSLYIGGYCDKKAQVTLRCVSKRDGTLLTGVYRFVRTDGEPVVVQLCPNSPAAGDNNFQAKLGIANSVPALEFRSDTIMSGGSDRLGTSYPQGRFAFDAQLFDIAEGATVSLVEMDTHQTGSAAATMTGGRLTGGGTFWNRSAAAVRFERNKETFTGLLRDSGGYGHNTGDRCGPTEIRSISTNCTAEAVGWVGVDGNFSPETNWRKSVGSLVLGNDHTHGATEKHVGTNWFPRVATLHGGRLQLHPEQTVWGEPGVADRKYAQRFVLADGFCYLRAYSRGTSGGVPINWFEAGELGHENKATLRIDDDSFKAASTASPTNQMTILHGWEEFAVGLAGNPESSDSYPTIPWIVAPLDGGRDKLHFPAFNSSDRLVRPVFANSGAALSSFSAGRNAYCRNAGIALTEDLTVNSLYLQNDAKGKTLGAGRTLTVTSGGLILSDVSDNANPGASTIGEEGGSANGMLVLGDEDHPAYVWACGTKTSSANNAPNEIWAKVTAPGGFVAAYTGHLVLGGDQTGIGDELVVNAGTLQLGTAASGCSLSKDLPVRIYANATLALPHENDLAGTILQFDGAAGWFGKVDLASNQRCRKLYVRDYPEAPEWENLVRGTYGCSGSSAEFIRDDLFTGTGVLTVLSDDVRQPTRILLF